MRETVGAGNVYTDRDMLLNYSYGETPNRQRSHLKVFVKPENTDRVSRVLSSAKEASVE